MCQTADFHDFEFNQKGGPRALSAILQLTAVLVKGNWIKFLEFIVTLIKLTE